MRELAPSTSGQTLLPQFFNANRFTASIGPDSMIAAMSWLPTPVIEKSGIFIWSPILSATSWVSVWISGGATSASFWK